MKNESLVEELAARTRVPQRSVQAVLDALAEMVREGSADARAFLPASFCCLVDPPDLGADPRDPVVVDHLVERAKAHPLGLEFLAKGHLGSVAATFQAHAFTVLAAREQMTMTQERV